MGVVAADGLAAMAAVDEVAGRFTTRVVGGVRTRLMLAKNPAGWSELLDLVGKDDGPIVISINARTADGADPSWLWDVPFERLAPRVVVATGIGVATCRSACTTRGWPTWCRRIL